MDVYHKGKWGTVCDDGWDLSDAQVVCNELGLDKAIAAKHGAFYGQDSGRIWLDSVDCDGSESAIRKCSHRGWGVHNCSHVEDASVKCITGTNIHECIVCICNKFLIFKKCHLANQ